MVRIRVKRPREGLIALLEYDFYDIQNNNKKYMCMVDTGAPQTILPFYIKRMLGRAGWSTVDARVGAGGYGAPARQFCASQMFEISIGDNDNWSKWVQKILAIKWNMPLLVTMLLTN